MSSSDSTIKVVDVIVNTEERDLQLLKEMLDYIGVKFTHIDDLVDKIVPRDRLLEMETVDYYNARFKPEWRNLNYSTGKLTSLRKNNVVVQKFPAVNMLRQILKCHKLHLKPHIQSLGYDPDTGKKRYRHEYIIANVFSYTLLEGEE